MERLFLVLKKYFLLCGSVRVCGKFCNKSVIFICCFFFVFRFFFKRTDRNFIGLDKVSKYAASCKYHRDPKVCSSLRCVSNPSLSSQILVNWTASQEVTAIGAVPQGHSGDSPIWNLVDMSWSRVSCPQSHDGHLFSVQSVKGGSIAKESQ